MAAEAIDRHARWRRNKIALYAVQARGEVRKFTFGDIAEMSSRFASGLEKLGAVKGDRIFVFLDRTAELYISILGITKMGGIAGPLFSALGPDAVKDRALDCGARFIVTSPYLYKRLEPIMDDLVDVERFIIVGGNEGLGGNTISIEELLESGNPNYQAVSMEPTDPHHTLHLRLHRQAQGCPPGAG